MRAMFNDRSTPLSLLATRRSGKPRDLVAPGPSEAELDAALQTAMRTPDHGKLSPWRFVLVAPADRAALGDRLAACLAADRPDATPAELDGARAFAEQAPALVVALSSPVPSDKVPLWEQELSAGAACMNLILAAHAEGFVAGWLTGWAAYSERVRDAFGAAPERIAGFIFIGHPPKEPEERPRPAGRVSTWQG